VNGGGQRKRGPDPGRPGRTQPGPGGAGRRGHPGPAPAPREAKAGPAQRPGASPHAAGPGPAAKASAPGRREATVGAYMTRAVVAVTPETPLPRACRVMLDHKISCVVVADGERPLGLISERTLTRRVGLGKPLEVPARSAMSSPPLCCPPDRTLAEALEDMRARHVRRLLVTEGGRLAGIITQGDLLEASRRQLAELAERHGRLRETARRDELTGLYNRRAFDSAFGRELGRVRRYGGLLSLAVFDLDHFKAVNDRFGHQAGDEVLRRFAATLRDCCREVDVPARHGGEEFAVMLPAAGTRAAAVYAERVRRETAALEVPAGGERLRVTVSAGVCKWTRATDSMRAMLAAADRELYRAKRAGRNRVCVAE